MVETAAALCILFLSLCRNLPSVLYIDSDIRILRAPSTYVRADVLHFFSLRLQLHSLLSQALSHESAVRGNSSPGTTHP